MRKFSLLLLLAFGVCWIPLSIAPATLASTVQAQNEKKEVRVWVNTRSHVYHCPGTRWYGNTKQGKYISESEAQKEGDRPAYGRSCGPTSNEKSVGATKQPSSHTSPPSGATALCRDGTYSFSQHRRGSCSHHGGVSKWLNPK